MIRRKFIFLCITLITIMSTVNGLTVSLILRDTLDDEVRHNFELILEQQYAEIHQMFSAFRSDTLTICSSEAVQNLLVTDESCFVTPNPKKAVSLLTTRTDAERSGFEEIEIIPLYNGQPCKWDKTGLLKYFPDALNENWYQQASLLPDNVLFLNEAPGQIYIVKGIYRTDNWTDIAGYAYMKLNNSSILSALHLSEGAAFLLDSENTLACPFVDYYGLSTILTEQTSEFIDIDGRNHLLLSMNIPVNGWKLVGLLPTDELYSKGDLVMKVFLATAFITFIIAVFIAVYLSDTITKPLMKLTQRMKASEENISDENGMLRTDIPPSYSGEVRILYESYNHMVEHIHALIDEIYITKIEEQEAEMRALQAQINPHFIYNTLDSINWMAAKYQASEIQNMIFLLSSMLRHSLNNGENEISIRGELEQLKSYIGIHQIRTPDCFEIFYHVDETLLDYRIKKLMLQPLVENVIEHGFNNINYKGIIHIHIFKEDKHIVLQVVNNGREPDLDKIAHLLNADRKEKTKSYGIRNVNTRLMNRYGPQCKIHYKYGEGLTTCTIRIPFDRL